MYSSLGVFSRFLALLVGLCLAFSRWVFGGDAVGARAVMDLRGCDFAGGEVAELRGESEFYWRQIITPLDFGRGFQREAQYVPMPSSWTSYSLEGGAIPSDGYATYRFFVVVPSEGKEVHYGLRVPVVYSSYRLWVNGEYCQEMGSVDTSPFRAQSQAGVALVPVHAVGRGVADTLEVVMQVSNYGYPVAGIRHPLVLGRIGALVTHSAMQIRLEFLLLGVLGLLIVFCAVFIRITKHGREPIWVVLSGLFFLVHVTANNGNFFFDLFPTFPWIGFHMLRYSTLLLSVLSGLMFIRQTFREECKSYFFYPLVALGVLQFLYVLMAPASYHSVLRGLVTSYAVLVLGCVCGAVLPFSHRRGGPLALPLLVGMGLLSLCYVVDVLFYSRGGTEYLLVTQVGAGFLLLSVMVPSVRQISGIVGRQDGMVAAHAREVSALRAAGARAEARARGISEEMEVLSRELMAQRWAERGYTLLAETIAQSPRAIAPMSQSLLDAFCQYVSVRVGALYMASYSLETMRARLQLTASVGLSEQTRREQGEVEENEGLVGAVYAENAVRYLEDLPEDFLPLSSGLGECTPPSLLLLPLQADAGVIGVLALGRLDRFTASEVAFAQRGSLMISNSLMHVRSVEDNLRMTREAVEARRALEEEQEALRQELLRLEARVQESEQGSLSGRGVGGNRE